MNDAGRDYKTKGCGRDWKIEHFPIYGEWPLLLLRGLLCCRKVTMQLVPWSSDLLTFSKEVGNQDVKSADLKILTANSSI